MGREIWSRARSRLLWALFLPLLAGSLGLTLAGILGGRLPAGITAALFCLTAALAAAFGMLVSRELPKAKAAETGALQLQAVYEVISKAGRSLELQEVLDSITSLTVEVAGVRACTIKLMDSADDAEGPDPADGSRVMRVRSMAGMRDGGVELTVDAAENIYARSLLDGESVRVEGASERDFPELDGGVTSLVCVPLRQETRVLGAMCVYSEKGTALPPETHSFLSRLGDLVVLSIRNASVYERLKKIDRTKTWFLLKASHELKSPLSGILSICQTILGGYTGEITAKQRELLDRVRFRSMVLLETANDLLALARARSRAREEGKETAELAGVLEETVGFYRTAAAEKNVTIVVSRSPEPVMVPCSAEEARSIMGNLISNAVKYSPQGAEVSVSLRTGTDGPTFTVKDRGIGIPESEKGSLFKEFFRATNARHMTEAGTGLGLAIVKSVVDGLGGSLDIQSAEGKGTSVTVVFGRPAV